MAKLFIGMPVYNGEQFIEKALDSLINQTFTDWELLIADNASTDKTEIICRKYVAKDARICYARHDSNKGGLYNFKFVFYKSTGPYFMCAACDDVWDRHFIEKGMQFLENNRQFDAWFPTISNIDTFDSIIRTYPSFERLTSTGNKAKDVFSFLMEPEILGRANPIYSIFRKQAVQYVIDQGFLDKNCWGADMCFNLAFISRYNLKCDRSVLFYKRNSRESDNQANPNMIVIKHPNKHIFPLQEMIPYFRANYNAVDGFILKSLVIVSFLLRFPFAFRNHVVRILQS